MTPDARRRSAFERSRSASASLAADRTPAGVAYTADTRERARSDLRAAMPAWLAQGLGGYTYLTPRPPRRDSRAYTEHLLAIHPIGTPDDCLAQLAATTQRTGIGHLILMVEGAGSPGHTLDNIHRLGAQVLPRLRATATSQAVDPPPIRPPGRTG